MCSCGAAWELLTICITMPRVPCTTPGPLVHLCTTTRSRCASEGGGGPMKYVVFCFLYNLQGFNWFAFQKSTSFLFYFKIPSRIWWSPTIQEYLSYRKTQEIGGWCRTIIIYICFLTVRELFRCKATRKQLKTIKNN